MRKRRALAWSLVLMVALVVGWRASRRPRPAVSAATMPPAAPVLAAVEKEARRQATARLARVPAPPPAKALGKFSAAEINTAQHIFRQMLAYQGLITSDRERRDLAAQLLAREHGAELAQKTLLDPAFAREAFGDFQAEARFFSVVVLDEAAHEGQLDLVTATGADLAAQLVAAGGEPDRGRAEDLIGIASVVGKAAGSQGLAEEGSPLLAKLGFSNETPSAVRMLYVRGLFDGVWRAEGFEKAQATAERLKSL